MKDKVKIIYITILLLSMAVILVLGIGYIHQLITDMGLYYSGDYTTKVSFIEAKFLGKFQNRNEEWYDYFELKNGEKIKLSFSRDGHTGEPSVLIIKQDSYANDRLIKTDYNVSTNLNRYLGRVGIYTDNFYIYDKEQGINYDTDILSGYTYMNDDLYQKNGMKVWASFNSEYKDENAISEFLLSEDESLIKDKYTYHKIDSYQTEIGTLYILGKEKQEADIKYTIYVGVLKYKEGNNQELIFELGYLHDNTKDITSIFKDIVKEVKIKNNVEE